MGIKDKVPGGKVETVQEKLIFSELKKIGLNPKCNEWIGNTCRVDFLFPEIKVVIEIDGDYHFNKHQRRKDYTRERFLILQGYIIFRFTNEEIEENAMNCALEVKFLIEGLKLEC